MSFSYIRRRVQTLTAKRVLVSAYLVSHFSSKSILNVLAVRYQTSATNELEMPGERMRGQVPNRQETKTAMRWRMIETVVQHQPQ